MIVIKLTPDVERFTDIKTDTENRASIGDNYVQ